MPDSTFAARLRQLRERAALSVADLAEAAGLGRDAVYKLERGQSVPTWPTVQALAAALGVSTEALRDSHTSV